MIITMGRLGLGGGGGCQYLAISAYYVLYKVSIIIIRCMVDMCHSHVRGVHEVCTSMCFAYTTGEK